MKNIAKKKKKIKKMTTIKKKTDVKVSPKQIERIMKKLSKLENRFDKSLEDVKKIGKNVRDLISETRVVESLQRDNDKLWNYSHDLGQRLNEIKSRMSNLARRSTQMLQTWEDEIKVTHERMNKFEDDLKSVRRLPQFYKDVNEKVAELEKQYNHIASDAMAKITELENTIKPEEEKMHKIVDLDTVKDQVEGIRKSMLTFNKLWADYKNTIDERLGLRPSQVSAIATEVISPKAEDELKSLRDIVNKLSLENEQIKTMARDIRVTQMGTPNTEVMTNVTSRLNTVEKKMTEVEQELSKYVKSKPIVME